MQWTIAGACIWLSVSLHAAVVEVDVQSRSDVLGGREFGSAGSYQRIVGRVRFAIDPNLRPNNGITDIRRAVRNSAGLIEFSADFEMLRPAELRKGNGTVLFEVVNRGKKGLLGTFNRARSGDDFGDGMLLNEGYTLVWAGWQHDVPRTEGLMRVYAPAAAEVKGLVRSEFTADKGTTILPLGDAGHSPYPIADNRTVTVSVRRGLFEERRQLPAGDWSFDEGRIRLSRPALAGELYEVIYESANPPVAGVGLAAIRDLISYLKKEHRHAIGFGTSQSAMVLRALLYEGFNQDEDGKRVFDGIFAHVAGGRRSTFQRFTQPSRTAGPFRNASLSTTDQFPFADAELKDRTSGRRDGVLAKANAAKVVPKIFYTNSAYEYWGSGASLLHTTPDGSADVELPPSTRMYMFAGGQHGPAAFPPAPGRGQNLANFNDYRPPMRALLKRLQSWVAQDQLPPDSVYPTIAAKTLVSVNDYRFPAITGISVPKISHVPHALDFGSQYRKAGVISQEPPRLGRPFGVRVPQSDTDGNDVGGVRMPEIDCAIGTFTGWNLRTAGIGLEQHLLSNTGSYLPFPRTAEERTRTGDPRLPIESRYANQEKYIACVNDKSDALIAAGLLLPSDKKYVAERATRHWQWRMQQPSVISSTQPR